jgi:anhydro-N-acetylmuramic acid kinase
MSDPNPYKAIGLMSGTSLDGLDMAYVEFTPVPDGWQFAIPYAQTHPYDEQWQQRLQHAVHQSAQELVELDVDLGNWFARAVNGFIQEHQLQPDFIASHGHTIFHQPEKTITWQAGSGFHLYSQLNIPVVTQFRNLDVALGGQGAPLVPLGDRFLFSAYSFCLNLGGIANISAEKDEQRMAYDICPANMVLNYLARQEGQPFDRDGTIASQGTCNYSLLTTLNQLNYYSLPAPKSLGYEWVEREFIPRLKQSNLSNSDLMATCIQHIAEQVQQALTFFGRKGKTSLLITGGGAYNRVLVNAIQNQCKSLADVVIPDKTIIDYKEALIFAFLGLRKLRNEVNCLASVTGAASDSSGGVVHGSVEW